MIWEFIFKCIYEMFETIRLTHHNIDYNLKIIFFFVGHLNNKMQHVS